MPTALITGASRGIGHATALRLAPTHHIIAVARSSAPLTELADQIAARGGSCEPLILDVTDWPAVAAALYNREVDVLVNNAGAGPIKPMLELTPEEWHRMVDLNFNAVYHVSRALLPAMIRRGSGHIINVSSIAGRGAFVGGTCYAATKHALNAFSESLMLEVRDHGIKVSVVSPGSVQTHFSPNAIHEDWRLSAAAVADTIAAVVDTPSNVLIHRLEVRTNTPPVKPR